MPPVDVPCQASDELPGNPLKLETARHATEVTVIVEPDKAMIIVPPVQNLPFMNNRQPPAVKRNGLRSSSNIFTGDKRCFAQ